MKKLTITETVIDNFYFPLDLDELITYLKNIRDEDQDYHNNLFINLDSGYNNISISLMGTREETDNEYNKRMQKEKPDKEKGKDKRRKEYLKLKKEFEEEGI